MPKSRLLQSLVIMLVGLLYLSVLQVSQSGARATEDSWITKTSMLSAVSGLKVVVVNDKIYAIAGKTNYEYDPATDTWTAKKPMPTPRYHFGVAVHQNKIYIIGGTIDYTWGRGPGRYCSANEVYDPLTDTWETKVSMPTNRSEVQASVVDGEIYCIGGQTSYDWDKAEYQRCIKNEVYDPLADTWETKMSMPTEKLDFDANVVGNKIYCIGGIPDSANVVYDPSTDNWTTKALMPIPVYAHMSAVIDHKIYILAGGPSPSDYNQIYDIQTDTWSSGKSMPSAVRSASVAVTTGTTAPKRIYVVGGGGFFDDPSDQTYVYDPEVDVWSTGALMPTPRGHPAIAIVDDLIYAIGGYHFWIEQTSAVEQYTPFGYGTIPQQPTPQPSEPSEPPEPFPTTLAVAAIVTVTVAGAGLLVYFKKRHHSAGSC